MKYSRRGLRAAFSMRKEKALGPLMVAAVAVVEGVAVAVVVVGRRELLHISHWFLLTVFEKVHRGQQIVLPSFCFFADVKNEEIGRLLMVALLSYRWIKYRNVREAHDTRRRPTARPCVRQDECQKNPGIFLA